MGDKFKNAKYWVACSTENALRIYFTYDKMKENAIDYSYIAAFDDNGIWFDEKKIDADAEDYAMFISDY